MGDLEESTNDSLFELVSEYVFVEEVLQLFVSHIDAQLFK
jgi:hypothetical protein